MTKEQLDPQEEEQLPVEPTEEDTDPETDPDEEGTDDDGDPVVKDPIKP